MNFETIRNRLVNKKKIKYLIVFIIFFMIFIPNLIVCLESQTNISLMNNSSETNLLYTIYPDEFVEQFFYFEEDAKVESIQLTFGLYADDYKNNLKVSGLVGNTYYDVPYTTENYKMNINLEKTGLQEIRSIKISNISSDETIDIYISSIHIYGDFYIGDQLSDDNIYLSVDVSTQQQNAHFRIIMFAVFSGFLVVTIKVFLSEKINDRKLLLLSMILIFLSYCLRYPRLTLLAEPMNETGTLFFNQTILAPAKDTVFLDDAGYLPLFQRIIAIILIKLFGLNRFVFLGMALIYLVIICFILSLFCHRAYDNYLPLELRFLTCLTLAFSPAFIGTGETAYILTFYNFSYVFTLLFILIYALDFTKLSMKYFIPILACSIFAITKSHFVIFVPITLVCILYHLFFKKKNLKFILFNIFLFITSFIQLIYSKGNSGFWGKGSAETSMGDTIFYFIKALYQAFYNFIQSFSTILFGNLITSEAITGISFNVIICILLFLILLFLFGNLKNNKNKNISYLIILCLSMCYGFWALLSLIIFYTPQATWLIGANFNSGYWQYIPIGICLFMGCFFGISIVFKKHKSIAYYCAFGLAIIVGFNAPGFEMDAYNRANWQNHYKMQQNYSYAIPINGTNFIGKNAEVLYIGNNDGPIENLGYTLPVSIYINTLNDNVNTQYISSIDFTKGENSGDKIINAVYVEKASLAQSNDIYLEIYDTTGKLVKKIKASHSPGSINITFILDESVNNVGELVFVNNNSNPINVVNSIFVSVATNK